MGDQGQTSRCAKCKAELGEVKVACDRRDSSGTTTRKGTGFNHVTLSHGEGESRLDYLLS